MINLNAIRFGKVSVFALAGVTLILVSMNVGTGIFAEFCAVWDGSIAGFACTILALVIFTYGLPRGMRAD